MATIAIGVVASVLTFAAFGYYGFIPVAITIIILLLPVEGFDEDYGATLDIIPLDNEQFNLRPEAEKTYYVKKDGKTVTYAHDTREKYHLDAKIYEEVKLKGNIKVFESEECEEPILKVYTKEPYTGEWSLTPFFKTKKYVFLVPKGTVYTVR